MSDAEIIDRLVALEQGAAFRSVLAERLDRERHAIALATGEGHDHSHTFDLLLLARGRWCPVCGHVELA